MPVFTTAETQRDLEGILALQQANLAPHLTAAERESEGFVTVVHTYNQLSKLNAQEKHIIAKAGDTIIGYLLAMTKKAKDAIPILVPMFNAFAEIDYNGKAVAAYNYIVVGQVCIDKQHRGQGILDACYALYQKEYSRKYDFAVTEIATANRRSRHAHDRIGFREIKTYTAPDGSEWVVVIWEWKAGSIS